MQRVFDSQEMEARGLKYRPEVFSYKNKVLSSFPLREFPSFASSVNKEWFFRLEQKPTDGRSNQFHANSFIRKFEEGESELLVNDFIVTATDCEIVEFAEKKAEKAAQLKQQGKLEDLKTQALSYKFELPVKSDDKLKISFERLACVYWWRRQLRKLARVTVDQVARENGKVCLEKEIYCANFTHKRRLKQKARNEDTLKKLEAVNQDGYSASLFELAGKCVSNPKIRRSELMVRMRGFEEIADELEHVGLFVTWTCPSAFHANSKKYQGATPKEANNYLTNQWAKARAKMGRQEISPYGLRVVEPHGDGTPHWHMLLFIEKEKLQSLRSILWEYALQVDGNEQGAIDNRCKFIDIDPAIGTASGYIAKYICKNIDGTYLNEQGEQITFNDIDSNGKLDSVTSAQKVEAWAAAHSIRQFQQIGGAPVGVWRELRKLKESDFKDSVDFFGNVEKAKISDCSANFKIAFAAADAGHWDLFLKAMGGIKAKRKEHTIKLLKEESEDLNCYGEQKPEKIIGVIDIETAQGIKTRSNFWQITFSKKEHKEKENNSEQEQKNNVVRFNFADKGRKNHQLVFSAFERAPPARALNLCQ